MKPGPKPDPSVAARRERERAFYESHPSVTVRDVAERFGVSSAVAWRDLLRAGATLRPKGQRKGGKSRAWEALVTGEAGGVH